MKYNTDNARILDLPSRAPFPPQLVERLTAMLRTEAGTQTLHPIQAEALYELKRCNMHSPELGIVARAGLGAGKSLISFLAGSMLPDVRGVVLLIPGGHRAKTLRALQQARHHWQIRHDILIHSYEELSRKRELLGGLVKRFGRLLVVADEAHKLSAVDSGRTRQVLHEAVQNPSIIWMPMSATLLKYSLRRAGHLYELALRDRSPLPLNDRNLSDWASVTDTDASSDGRAWAAYYPLYRKHGGTEQAWEDPDRRLIACREILAKHFEQSVGVVTNQDSSAAGCSLNIIEESFSCPQVIESNIQEIKKTGILPASGGIAITHPWAMDAVIQEASQGMFYYHDWSQTRLGKPDDAWLGPRKAYAAEVRDFLGMDGAWRFHQIYTPGQLEQAFLTDPKRFSSTYALAYHRWKAVENRYQIRTMHEAPGGPGEVITVTPIWLTEEIIDRMVAAMQERPIILWYSHIAVAMKLRDRGMDVFFPQSGDKARNPETAKGKHSIALSLRAHSDGFNLQQFAEQVFPCPSSDAMRMAQAVGRSHRYGQKADEVTVRVWLHTSYLQDAWVRCQQHANTEHQRGQKNALAVATIISQSEDSR